MNQNKVYIKNKKGMFWKKIYPCSEQKISILPNVSSQIQDHYRTKLRTHSFRAINNPEIYEGRSLTLKSGSGNGNISRSLAQNQLGAVGITGFRFLSAVQPIWKIVCCWFAIRCPDYYHVSASPYLTNKEHSSRHYVFGFLGMQHLLVFTPSTAFKS